MMGGGSRRDSVFEAAAKSAARSIGSGIRTSAVINVGTATIAALIGAGRALDQAR